MSDLGVKEHEIHCASANVRDGAMFGSIRVGKYRFVDVRSIEDWMAGSDVKYFLVAEEMTHALCGMARDLVGFLQQVITQSTCIPSQQKQRVKFD